MAPNLSLLPKQIQNLFPVVTSSQASSVMLHISYWIYPFTGLWIRPIWAAFDVRYVRPLDAIINLSHSPLSKHIEEQTFFNLEC